MEGEEKKVEGEFGLAEDGTQYSAESPAVIKYKEIFPDVTEVAAIGSIVGIHNILAKGAGMEPAEGSVNIDEVINLVKENLTEEVAPDSEPEATEEGEAA